MADTGRFQELSPTKIQEILDNAVSDKNEESHKVGMNMFNARIWEFQSKTITTVVTFIVDVWIIL